MEELKLLVDEYGTYRVVAIEYKVNTNDENKSLYAIDTFKITKMKKNEAHYTYERKIVFNYAEEYCAKVAMIGIQPISKKVENSTFLKFSEQQFVEEADAILKDLPAKASLILSNLLNFVFGTTAITPPKYLKNKFEL